MTSPRTIAAWPAEVERPFSELYATLASVLPTHSITTFEQLGELSTMLIEQRPAAVVLVLDREAASAAGPAQLIEAMSVLAAHSEVSVAVVVGDGYLGTDTVSIETDTGIDAASLISALAVSGVRSLALRRHRPGRSNVVCVPQSSFGAATELRGPLAQPTETIDIAHALAFLLDESGRYVSGDVLFVNGGRHLFSSHTA